MRGHCLSRERWGVTWRVASDYMLPLAVWAKTANRVHLNRNGTLIVRPMGYSSLLEYERREGSARWPQSPCPNNRAIHDDMREGTVVTKQFHGTDKKKEHKMGSNRMSQRCPSRG